MSEMKLKGLLMKLVKLKKYKFLFIINFIILVLFFNYDATACSDRKFAKKEIFIVNKINNQKIKFNVELADTDLKRKTGLQCKKQLKANEGMLFIWKSEDQRYFWMKNTKFYLDIIFINSDLEIIDIYFNAKPFSLLNISSSRKAQYVLEINEGVFKNFDLMIGDKLLLQK